MKINEIERILENYNEEHIWIFNYSIADKLNQEGSSSYEIIFDYENNRYYFCVLSKNVYEALGIFFCTHPFLSMKNVIDTVEI